MKFKLEIDCNNAAFEDNPAGEIARILRQLSEGVESSEGVGWSRHWQLCDVNGNVVGGAWNE